MHIHTGRQKLKKKRYTSSSEIVKIYFYLQAVELSLPADDFITDLGSYEGLNIYTYHNFVKTLLANLMRRFLFVRIGCNKEFGYILILILNSWVK